jgi:autotransporter-associated beta strand protein
LTDDIALPGVEIINLGTDANLKLFGTGAAMLKASKNIALATRSSIEAVNGTITLSANQQNAPSGGDFVGIDLANNTLVRTSGSGNLLLQGRGGNDGTTGGHSGIRLQQSSRLETTGVGLATGQGLISLSGTGGNGNAGNDGVTINGCFGSAVCTTATGIFSSGDGSVQITGTGGDSISPAINLAFATIDTSLGTANVTLSLTGDSLNIADSATVSANNHLVGLLPRTFGFAINLGDSDNPSQLGLTDAELDRVTAGTINIGDANSGPITISAAIDRAAGSTTAINLTTGTNKSIEFSGSGSLDAKNGNVTLLTNSSGSGAITSGMAAIDVSGANLSLTAGSGGIGASGNPLVVSATNLNALTGGNGNQFLSASDSTTIDATGLSAETGTIELDAGLFTLGGSNRVNDSTKLNVNGATFALGANHETVDTLTLTSGSITGASGILTSTNTIQTKSGSISAILASANGLTQLTTGTTMLSGANTYSGDTTISAGTLKLSASNVIPDGSGKGNVVLNPASGTATLDLGGFSETVNGLSNSGAGSSVVNNSANGGPFTLTVGGNDQDSAFSGVIQNAAGTLALTKIGTGTLTLSGANTYRGNTTISGGTLKLGAANVIPDGTGTGNVVFNPAGGTATFDLNGFSETINGLSNSGAGTSIVDNSVSGGPFTLTLGANDQTSTFSGAMKNTAGTVALTKIGNGTLTLSGANTYSGDTTISVGTLKLGAANA